MLERPPNPDALLEHINREKKIKRKIEKAISEKKELVRYKAFVVNGLIIGLCYLFFVSGAFVKEIYGIFLMVGVVTLLKVVNTFLEEYERSLIKNIKKEAQVKDLKYCYEIIKERQK